MSILDETNSSFYSDGIYAARSLLNEHFNLTFSNVIKYTDHDYKADGDYAVDIYISNSDVIYLTFNNMISLNDGALVSSVDHPLINKYLADMNGLFYIFDAMRFTTESMKVFYPVIENLNPTIVFRYSILFKEMNISLQLFNKIEKENDVTLCVITKDTIIQHAYEPSYFQHIYGLGSPFYHSDLLIYKERLLKVWDISADSTTVDYKQMGQLTDMIHI